MAKVFIGGWVDSKTRKEFKMKCAELDVTQQDIIECLILGWMNKKHIKNER